jgi:hypothetical protein
MGLHGIGSDPVTNKLLVLKCGLGVIWHWCDLGARAGWVMDELWVSV